MNVSKANMKCPVCGTKHTEKIDINAAQRKLGEEFLKITEYERK